MSWDYLDTDIFQTRFGIVAAYLKERAYGKTILDMNCGQNAQFLHHFKSGFKQYIGNDVLAEESDEPYRFISPISDVYLLDFLKNMGVKIDIFLHLGAGMGKIAGESVESMTETASGCAIVDYYKPEIVILESIRRFACQMGTDYEGTLIKNGYKLAHQLTLTIDKDSYVSTRIFQFYEKRT
jgi:hypothetical protein